MANAALPAQPAGAFPPWHGGLGTTYYEAATLWMGDDPGTWVTDPFDRFHQIQNAYACDQSIFPYVAPSTPDADGPHAGPTTRPAPVLTGQRRAQARASMFNLPFTRAGLSAMQATKPGGCETARGVG